MMLGNRDDTEEKDRFYEKINSKSYGCVEYLGSLHMTVRCEVTVVCTVDSPLHCSGSGG